jgi:uncharacterized membrane protein YedE/YeeE
MPTEIEPTPRRRLLTTTLFVTGGAIVGFGYYYFVGCQTGTCPLTSNPYISTAYGALVGLLFGRG